MKSCLPEPSDGLKIEKHLGRHDPAIMFTPSFCQVGGSVISPSSPILEGTHQSSGKWPVISGSWPAAMACKTCNGLAACIQLSSLGLSFQQTASSTERLRWNMVLRHHFCDLPRYHKIDLRTVCPALCIGSWGNAFQLMLACMCCCSMVTGLQQ